jgi:23S rRNA (guanosine2251-2'-O)-methyltransferase
MIDRRSTIEELGRVTAEDHLLAPKLPVRVVLDDVRSRHNVGSVFRSADAFGIEGIILGGFTPLPPHREIEKTALGATRSVPWEHAPDVVSSIRSLKAAGYTVWAVEQTVNAIPLDALRHPLPERLAIVLGNELNGVSDPVIAECDACVVIPQRGSKHSLNVSVCAGIVLWACCGSVTCASGPRIDLSAHR